MSALARFFGGNPIWVLIRLVALSVIVGVILAAIGLTPYDLYREVTRLFRSVYAMGFDAVEEVARYFLVGAIVVFPIWLVSRLLKLGRGAGSTGGGHGPRRQS